MTGAIVTLLLIAGGFVALILFAGKIFRSGESNKAGGDGAPIYYGGDAGHGHVHSDSCGHGDAGSGGDGGGGGGGGD